MKSAGKSDSNWPPTLIQTWPLVQIQIGQFGPTSTWQAPDTMSENGQEQPVGFRQSGRSMFDDGGVPLTAGLGIAARTQLPCDAVPK